MRQTHLGGDRILVDYAGDTIPVVVDRLIGEIREAHLFAAVMGASSFSFAWPTWTEKLPDRVDAHVRTFAFFGGGARLPVPDNAKVAVIKACLYEPRSTAPTANWPAITARRCYQLGLIGLATRRRSRPVSALSNSGCWGALAAILIELNGRPMRRLGRSRQELFDELDRLHLKPLPAEPYVLAEWRRCKVGIDYHVEVSYHFYSVPYRHARAQVDLRPDRYRQELARMRH